MNRSTRFQSGAVLPVSLFILVIVTLLVVSSAQTTNTGLQIVFAQQAQLSAETTAVQRAEQMLGDSDWFDENFSTIVNAGDTDGVTTDGIHTSLVNGLVVRVNKPTCIGVTPVLGYSTQVLYPPEQVYWDSEIEVIDPVTGARSVLTQGARLKMTFNSCKAL